MTEHNLLIMLGLVSLHTWLMIIAIRVALTEQGRRYERVIKMLRKDK